MPAWTASPNTCASRDTFSPFLTAATVAETVPAEAPAALWALPWALPWDTCPCEDDAAFPTTAFWMDEVVTLPGMPEADEIDGTDSALCAAVLPFVPLTPEGLISASVSWIDWLLFSVAAKAPGTGAAPVRSSAAARTPAARRIRFILLFFING